MKKALAMLLTLAMALSMLPMAFADVAEAPLAEAPVTMDEPAPADTAPVPTDEAPLAVVDEAIQTAGEITAPVNAGTLQSQIDAASSGTTVALTEDVTEDITIPAGKTIILDLAGHKLTNAGGHTIYVQKGAALTVTGSGTVDNVTHGRAALFNNGTVSLQGGTFTRSMETGEVATGKNSYYTVLNHGNMTITSGTTINQGADGNGNFSSLIENGYYNYSSQNETQGYVNGTNEANPKLTIEGGSFNGGLNTIKNDDGGAGVHGIGRVGHDGAEGVFLQIGHAGGHVGLVHRFGRAAAGVAGEEGKGVGPQFDGLAAHGEIAFG